MLKINVLTLLCVICFTIPSIAFSQVQDDENTELTADKVQVLSKSDQKQRFPLVSGANCIGVFLKRQLKGCIWANVINLTPRLQILKKIKFDDWDGKKVKSFYDLYYGVTHRIMLIGDFTFGKYITHEGLVLKYRAMESIFSIGYAVEIGAVTVLPIILKKFPMELSAGTTLIKNPN